MASNAAVRRLSEAHEVGAAAQKRAGTALCDAYRVGAGRITSRRCSVMASMA